MHKRILAVCVLLCLLLSACTGQVQDTTSTTSEVPSFDSQLSEEQASASETETADTQNNSYSVTAGTEEYLGFLVDNILHSESLGDIHFNLYVPDGYDGSEAYALYFTLPGYEALYFQGVAENLRQEDFAVAAREYDEKMIIVAPQLGDWGETSANQTVELLDYFLSSYNINRQKIYANGYSGGGETMSLVLEKCPELFTAYLHCNSRWDGDLTPVVKNRLPVYIVVGESDEYYGASPSEQAYEELHRLYLDEGLTEEEIAALLVLDIKEKSYFSDQGVTNQHAGQNLYAHDSTIMGWLFAK